MAGSRAPSRRTPPTMIDLFAGCGGMTQGFVDAGFEPVLAVEADVSAASSYAANFGEEHVLCMPIEDVGLDAYPEADVLIGGPPCQGFSNLGKRHSFDKRNSYWEHYVDVVAQVRPKLFVLENVQRFLKSTQFRLLKLETGDNGRLAGYSIEAFALNAADFGVPQRRTRAIVVGSRIGPVGAPPQTHARNPNLTAEPWVPVRQVLSDLDPSPPVALPESQVTFFGQRVPGVFKGLDIHVGRTYQERSLRRFEHIPPGGNRLNIPEDLLYDCWKKHKTGAMDVMGRLRWEEPAVTIRTEFFKPDKGRYLHPQWDDECQVNRALTHLEAARLQTFPDSFQWCGSKVEIARQIGNAVPPGLATAIATHLASRLE